MNWLACCGGWVDNLTAKHHLTIVLPLGRKTVPSTATVTTTLSSKGQMVLPKALRDLKQWKPGAQLLLEDVPGGVMVKLVEAKKKYTVDDLIGILKYDGPPLSQEEIDRRIDESIAEEVREGRW
jgi:AbrB family looped-hinge helix DNA binding protein